MMLPGRTRPMPSKAIPLPILPHCGCFWPLMRPCCSLLHAPIEAPLERTLRNTAALYHSAAHQLRELLSRALGRCRSDLPPACVEPGYGLRDAPRLRPQEEFVGRYRPVLYAAARAIVTAAGEARARELADSLYADLYIVKDRVAGSGRARSIEDAGPRRSLLDYFHGRSKLSTWLRAAVARQRHVDALRAGQRTGSLDSGDAREIRARLPRGASVTAQASDPDRARLLPRLQQAVSEALAELPPPDRLLLALYYVEELTLAQIARLRDIHEATASRYLERIRRELRQAVERGLAAGRPAQNGSSALPALSPAEVQLCFD